MHRQKTNLEQNLAQIKYEYQQLSARIMEVKGEFREQQVVTSDLRQEVSRLNEERNDRQRVLKELTSQYERESQQLNDVSYADLCAVYLRGGKYLREEILAFSHPKKFK